MLLSSHRIARKGLARLVVSLFVCASSAAQAAEEQPICPDRPSKSTGPCTVPLGKWQIETGLIDWSHATSAGVSADSAVWGNTAIKYGISSRADVELWLTPFETLSTHGNGVHEHYSSFGDTLLRVKYALTKDGAPVQVALDPFVKIPTANHWLGNGKVEGGLLVPITATLGKSPFTIAIDPELDVRADQDGSGHHAAMIQLINLGWQVNKQLSLTTELWGQWDWNPTGTGKQASWDGSIAYLLNKDVQLDGGANFGLNKQTPDVELYTGVSVRF